jgi:hypothetical protein
MREAGEVADRNGTDAPIRFRFGRMRQRQGAPLLEVCAIPAVGTLRTISAAARRDGLL